MTATVIVSCTDVDCLLDETKPSTVLEVKGNTAVVVAGDEEQFIELDSVKVAEGYEVIDVADTLCKRADEVDFSSAKTLRSEVLSQTLKKKTSAYVVREWTICTYIGYQGIFVPIVFTRDVVSAVRSDGSETPSDVYHHFTYSSVYIGTEKMKSDEESHSRSYYDLTINVEDLNEHHIGTILVRVSFYTANAVISFGATVEDYQNVNTETSS